MKGFQIKYKWLFCASMAYIYLPVFIFVFGWLKTGFAAFIFGACAFCFFRVNKKNTLSQTVFAVDPVVLVLSVLLFAGIGYYAGYGRFVDQASDWNKHNAILTDLVKRSWPVLYSNGKEHSMLTYYIGQYMVPAAVGKAIHSVRIAEIALYAWNIAGLILVFLNILFYTREKSFFGQFLYAFMMPFFSIPLWISEVVLKNISIFNKIGSRQWYFNDNGILIQYSSNYVLLRWVFAQVIPVWLIVIIFLIHKDKIEYYVLFLLPDVFFGTLTFLGIFPIAVGTAAEYLCKEKKLKKWLKQIFSAENIIVSATLGAVLFLYFYGNVTGEKPPEIGFGFMPYTTSTIVIYLTFVGVNILPYAVILFKDHVNDSIFYTAILSLLILPLFKMGLNNDLTMRASISGLFVLMIYVIQNMIDRIKNYNGKGAAKTALLVTVLFLMVGTYYPFMELTDSVQADDFRTLGKEGWNTLEDFANRSLEEVSDGVKYNYYSYDLENNFFCRHLMKNR